MSLYLCVFAEDWSDDDMEGVEIGGYDDFHAFRELVAVHVEANEWGTRCPTLMNHADSEGVWTVEECAELRAELDLVESFLRAVPPLDWAPNSWQVDVARSIGLTATNAADSLIDVDGEPLIMRLKGLTEFAVSMQRPITFM